MTMCFNDLFKLLTKDSLCGDDKALLFKVELAEDLKAENNV
jgi:hypothetical protein